MSVFELNSLERESASDCNMHWVPRENPYHAFLWIHQLISCWLVDTWLPLAQRPVCSQLVVLMVTPSGGTKHGNCYVKDRSFIQKTLVMASGRVYISKTGWGLWLRMTFGPYWEDILEHVKHIWQRTLHILLYFSSSWELFFPFIPGRKRSFE